MSLHLQKASHMATSTAPGKKCPSSTEARTQIRFSVCTRKKKKNVKLNWVMKIVKCSKMQRGKGEGMVKTRGQASQRGSDHRKNERNENNLDSNQREG